MIDGQGIVLKTFFTTRCKSILLDPEQGKIECIAHIDQLCIGSLIRYTIDARVHFTVISHIEYIAVPLEFTRHDLFFYHHVLELCYYFVPLASAPSSLFYFVKQLLFIHPIHFTSQYKIFFLVRLCMLLGIHSEIPVDQLPRLTELFARDVDSIIIESIDLKTVDEMRQWLKNCLAIHPLLKQFKTLHFLNSQEMELV